MIPPLTNCVLEWIGGRWNNETQEPDEQIDVHMWPGEIGDPDAISYVDNLFKYIHLLPTYKYVLDGLLDAGYVRNKNVFGVPNDWRYGVLQKPEFWKKFTDFIEKTVDSLGEKAVLVGHSMGTYLIHRLVTELTTPEWRRKYLDSTVLLAPSVTGVGLGFDVLWYKSIPIFGSFPESIAYFGGAHTHLFNREIFKDLVIYRGPNGETATADKATEFLKAKGKMDGDISLFHQKYFRFFEKAPIAPDIPVAILYNSGISTQYGVNETDPDNAGFLYGRGDLMVNAEGPEWLCANWHGPDCQDLKYGGAEGNHLSLLWMRETIDFVVQHVTKSEWQEKSKKPMRKPIQKL
jgi:pimeloyl-ACP methyl ester carboxylesterase